MRNDDWSEYKATFYDDDNTNKDDDGDNDDHDNDDENDDDDGDDENDDDLGNLRLAFVLGEYSKWLLAHKGAQWVKHLNIIIMHELGDLDDDLGDLDDDTDDKDLDDDTDDDLPPEDPWCWLDAENRWQP